MGGSRTGQTSTTIPLFNNAEFLLTIVPEPASALTLLAAAGTARRSRRSGAHV